MHSHFSRFRPDCIRLDCLETCQSSHTSSSSQSQPRSLLINVNSGTGSAHCHVTMCDIQRPRKLLWLYCPGHAGVRGNDRDGLAGKATSTNGWSLARCVAVRHTTWGQKAKNITPLVTWRRRRRKKIFLGRTCDGYRQSDQHCNCFTRRERVIVRQTNIETVSKDEKGSSSDRPTLELFQRTRKGHRQADQHWSCFKDEKGPSSDRPTLELFQRTRKGHRQTDQHRNCFKGRERAIVRRTNTGALSKDEKGPSSDRPALELFQRTRKGHCQSDQYCNCFKGRARAIVSQANIGTS